MIRFTTIIMFLLMAMNCVVAQGVIGIKTNLIYEGVTFSPNLGVELGLNKQTTLDIAARYNPWNVNGNNAENKKNVHFIVQPEFRYFLCERFNGHPYNFTEYKKPIEFTAKMYPENIIANVSTSSVAFSVENLSMARQYLIRFDQRPELWNNLGVTYMIEGDYKSARQYFPKTIHIENVEAGRAREKERYSLITY